jgi:hypothetical protein
MNLLISALQEILKKEVNPIKCFCLEAFIKNYGNKTMQSLLENSINRAQNVSGRGFTIDQFMFELIQNTFTLPPPKEEEQEEWLRKNAELMDKSPHRDFLFLYFKSQIENNLLATLGPEELKLYVEDLKEDASSLHLPCRTSSGFKVLRTKTFRDIDELLAECKP